MLLILFLNVKIEHAFVFPKITLHTGEKKSKDNVGCSKSTLKTSLKHLLQICYFMAGNLLLRQKTGIGMGNDPAPFWANLFLYKYEKEYMSEPISNDKVKARHFHSTKCFIDDLGTLNDEGAFSVYRDIYPPELQLKFEHSGTHATFLNLDITVKDGVFVYKLFDKRDAFPFFVVRIPYTYSNIP